MKHTAIAALAGLSLALPTAAQGPLESGASSAFGGVASSRAFRASNLIVDGGEVRFAVGVNGRAVRLRGLSVATGAPLSRVHFPTNVDDPAVLLRRPGTEQLFAVAFKANTAVAETGRVLRFHPTTGAAASVAAIPDMLRATGAAFSADGAQLVVDYDENASVFEETNPRRSGIDAVTGSVLWTVNPFGSVGSQLVATPHGVLQADTFRPLPSEASRNVRMIDPATGALVWSFSMAKATHQVIAASGDGSVGFSSGTVLFQPAPPEPTVFFDAATGATLWTSTEIATIAALDQTGSTVVAAERIAGGGVEVRAHDGASGAVLWSTPLATGEISTPVVLEIDPAGGRAVLASVRGGFPAGDVAHTGLDLSDGSVLWSSVESYGVEALPTDVAFGAGGEVLIAVRAEDVGTRSIVTAFDPQTQSEIWSYVEGVSGL